MNRLALLILASGVIAPNVAAAQTVTRGPYLQRGAPTAMTVVWRTSAPVESYVYYVELGDTTIKSVSSATPKTQHEMVITGLKPQQRYLYAVGTSTTLLAYTEDFYFDTPPTHGTATKLRAWIVGDSGTGGSRQRAVRDAMVSHVKADRPNIFLHMGDMAYNNGTTSEFQRNFFDIYKTMLHNTVCWPTLGNHEAGSSLSGPQIGPYYDAYVLPKAAESGGLASGTEAYYSFDHANVHFVVLDSHDSPRATSGAMLTWLRNDLAATSQRWIVAYFHHPPYTKGSHDSDSSSDSGGRMIDMRRNALPILEAAGVDLVLGGHSHIYERSFLVNGAYGTPTVSAGHIVDGSDGKVLGAGPYRKAVSATRGAVYIVAGHGGAGVSQRGTHPLMYFTERNNGSVILDVDRNVLSLFNLRHDGVVTDRMAIAKGDALVMGAPDGGEALIGGTISTIRWATVGTIPRVKLDYSIDGGKNWVAIGGAIANTGSFAWTVPRASTTSALVRVVSDASATVYDDSNARFTIAPTAPRKFISMGDVWKYHDQGVDLGTTWRNKGFDDSAWASGPGQLGYGDGDEATRLLNPSPKFPSVYFRKTIRVDGKVTAATVEALHDDGVAVWVNGTLVMSQYVAGGLNHGAFASQQSSENERTTRVINLTTTNPFVEGDNVVAVIVKQVSTGSSDTSFDMNLTLTVETKDVYVDAFATTVSGRDVRFTGRLCHAGAPTPADWSVKLWFDRATAPTCADAGDAEVMLNLPAGTCASFDELVASVPPGNYRPWILVDGRCQITEPNETNNVRSAPFTIAP